MRLFRAPRRFRHSSWSCKTLGYSPRLSTLQLQIDLIALPALAKHYSQESPLNAHVSPAHAGEIPSKRLIKQNFSFYITVTIYCFLALMPVSILNEAGWVKTSTFLESHYNMLACAMVCKKCTCLYHLVEILLITSPAKVANMVNVKAPTLPQMSMWQLQLGKDRGAYQTIWRSFTRSWPPVKNILITSALTWIVNNLYCPCLEQHFSSNPCAVTPQVE